MARKKVVWTREPLSAGDPVSYNRIAEESFAEGSAFEDHLVWAGESRYPKHRVQIRQLANGKWMYRPASYQGDDVIVGPQSALPK